MQEGCTEKAEIIYIFPVIREINSLEHWNSKQKPYPILMRFPIKCREPLAGRSSAVLCCICRLLCKHLSCPCTTLDSLIKWPHSLVLVWILGLLQDSAWEEGSEPALLPADPGCGQGFAPGLRAAHSRPWSFPCLWTELTKPWRASTSFHSSSACKEKGRAQGCVCLARGAAPQSQTTAPAWGVQHGQP